MWHVVFAASLLIIAPLQPGTPTKTGVADDGGGKSESPPSAAASDQTPAPKVNARNSSKSLSEDQTAGTDSGSKDRAAPESVAPDSDAGAVGAGEPRWTDVLNEILSSGAIGELRRGGFFMWPILILGIVAAGVVLERWRSLKMVGTDTATLRRDVLDLLESDRVEDALATCDSRQGPVPYVLAVGLRKYLVLRRLGYDPGQVSDQVVRAMDDHSVHIVAALERHLPILATVSSVAPMLGFLGTVQGMVISFREIVARMGETNIVEAAATGINIALLTTVFGLIVGIPTYIAYNYFTSVINGYVLQVQESATELIETVTLKMALEAGDPSNSG